jgi:hypothetical protein
MQHASAVAHVDVGHRFPCCTAAAYWVLHDVQHISAQEASVIPCRVGGPAAGVGRRVQRLPSSKDVADVCVGDAAGADAGDATLLG